MAKQEKIEFKQLSKALKTFVVLGMISFIILIISFVANLIVGMIQ